MPGRVLEFVFSYLDLRELRSCALVCKMWYRVLHGDENSEVWRSLAARSLAEEALRTDILCNVPTYKGKVRLFAPILCRRGAAGWRQPAPPRIPARVCVARASFVLGLLASLVRCTPFALNPGGCNNSGGGRKGVSSQLPR